MLTASVNSRTFHVILSVILAIARLYFLSLYLILSYTSQSFSCVFEVFSLPLLTYQFIIYLTPMSALFSALVTFITSVVLSYSYFYIGFYYNYKYFLFTTLGFVVSMLVVINFGDLFMVMLGWDGLGVISFFLIVYYNSSNAMYSGLFTILINRIGDGLLVLRIALFSYTFPLSTVISLQFTTPRVCAIIVLVLGLITKSALFPFSPWLPAAMSAPTPISSLVHSSTLVTAGLYLMIRFSSYLYSVSYIIDILLLVRIFTTFYAGLNSVVESDLKKLVALSTLSHLGFIGLAFSSGWESLALFHLFSHALFKSLLFMSIGEVISNQTHYQDIRYLSSGLTLTPMSSSYIFVSSLSLIGLPFVRGFYSKDIVLERLFYRDVLSSLSLIIVYVNLIFTYVYSTRLVHFCIKSSLLVPYQNTLSSGIHTYQLSFLSLVSLVFGQFFLSFSSLSSPLVVLPIFRCIPFILLLSVLLFYLFSSPLSKIVPFPSSVAYLGSIMFLRDVCSSLSSRSFFARIPHLIKSFEHGVLPRLSMIMTTASRVSATRVLWPIISSPIYITLVSVLFTFVVVLISLFIL